MSQQTTKRLSKQQRKLQFSGFLIFVLNRVTEQSKRKSDLICCEFVLEYCCKVQVAKVVILKLEIRSTPSKYGPVAVTHGLSRVKSPSFCNGSNKLPPDCIDSGERERSSPPWQILGFSTVDCSSTCKCTERPGRPAASQHFFFLLPPSAPPPSSPPPPLSNKQLNYHHGIYRWT
jgi:hypothetical protein